MGRYALLIGGREYDDEVLRGLRPVGGDVESLAAALRVPGGFDQIDVLQDIPAHELHEAIEGLLVGRRHSDVVLIYIACHAVFDARGRMYFATKNSRLDRMASTTVSLEYLDSQLAATSAEVRTLLLDCCFSGLHGDVLSAPQFRRAPIAADRSAPYVLMSATSLFEYALDSHGAIASHPQRSTFTMRVANGITNGDADYNRDGFISTVELFRLVDSAHEPDTSLPRPLLRGDPRDTAQFLCLSPHGFLSDVEVDGRPSASSAQRSDNVQRWFRLSYADDPEEALRLYAQVANLLSVKAATEAARVVPRELPLEIAAFTGRRSEIEALHRALRRGGPADGIRQIAVVGAAGVGKTALAVHWAHSVADQYPDGQIYLDLRGPDVSRPVDVAQALGRLLRSLRVPPGKLPASLENMRKLFNALVQNRRIVFVLDGAVSLAQVKPLLPEQSRSLVITTSRSDIWRWARSASRYDLPLGPLIESEAVELLQKLTGRGEQERATLLQVAMVCARLPLALRVVGEHAAHVVAKPLVELVKELVVTKRRVQDLTINEHLVTAVRTAELWSYDQLTRRAARTYRLAGLHVSPEFDISALAALTGDELKDVGDVVDELTRFGLVRQVARHGRFRFHDLVYQLATERARTEEAAGARRDAVEELLAWYLHTCDQAELQLSPHRQRVTSVEPPRRTAAVEFDGYDAALEWLETERVNLIEACRTAFDQGFDELAWQLAVSLWDFFNLRKYWSDWIDTGELGLAAAKRSGDRHGEGLVLNTLGNAHLDLREYQQAIDFYLQALAIVRDVNDRWSEAWVLDNLGKAYLGRNEAEEAIRYLGRSLDLRVKVHDHWGEGWTLAHLGDAHRALGQFRVAGKYYEESRVNRLESGDLIGEAYLRRQIGGIQRDLGQYDMSVASYEQALQIFEKHHDLSGRAATLSDLGVSLLALYRLDEAAEACRHASEIAQSLGDRWAEATALRRLGNVALQQHGLDAAREIWLDAHRLSRDIGDYSDDLPLLELPERRPRIWVDDGSHVRAGHAFAINFSYVNPDNEDDSPAPGGFGGPDRAFFLRIVLVVPGADVAPVTARVPLSNDRTTPPSRFVVTPRREGVLRLQFTVYVDRTGELLQQVAVTLDAGSGDRVA